MFILYLVNPINFLNIRKVDLWGKKINKYEVRSGSVNYLSNPNHRKTCVVVVMERNVSVIINYPSCIF